MHPILREKLGLALYLLGWALVGILLAYVIAGQGAASWLSASILAVPLTILYAFVCLSAWYVCVANPLSESTIVRVIGAQLAGGALSSGILLLTGAAWARIATHLPHAGEANDLFVDNTPLFFAAGILLYLLAATMSYLLLAFEASRESARKALELEVLAREAELQAFRTQIDPHFLFNCLNSISSLCGSDPKAARRTAVRLGDFLRASLRLGSDDTIPLAEELQLCEAYLDVERVRFGERLSYRQEVADNCRTVQVPALLLQPLLENALKHGIAQLIEGGEVSVTSERRGDRLAISVRNSCDPDRPRNTGSGIGLANVRGRLELLYGQNASFVTSEEDGSFRVEIRLPVAEGSVSERKAAHG